MLARINARTRMEGHLQLLLTLSVYLHLRCQLGMLSYVWSSMYIAYTPNRPDLSWRDIQHLCVRTAKMINSDDPDWEDTAAGRRFSYKYGYGNLDALTYVKAAQTWELVKPQAWLMMDAIQLNGGIMTAEGEMTDGELIPEGGVTSKMTVTQELLVENNFEALEHITVKVWISHSKRGDVEVELISPKGIKSMLAETRKRDGDRRGFMGWRFMTVKHW